MLLRDEEDLPVWLHAHASALPCSPNESERSHWERQAARRAALSNAARGLHMRLPSALALRDACSVDDDLGARADAKQASNLDNECSEGAS